MLIERWRSRLVLDRQYVTVLQNWDLTLYLSRAGLAIDPASDALFKNANSMPAIPGASERTPTSHDSIQIGPSKPSGV